MTGFSSIVDRQSMLELVEPAETRITSEAVQALHHVFAELDNYIRRMAPSLEALQLLTRAKQMVGFTSR